MKKNIANYTDKTVSVSLTSIPKKATLTIKIVLHQFFRNKVNNIEYYKDLESA